MNFVLPSGATFRRCLIAGAVTVLALGCISHSPTASARPAHVRPAVSASQVSVVSPGDGFAYGFNAANGLMLWKDPVSIGAIMMPRVAHGIAYVLDKGNAGFSAIRASDGAVLWSKAYTTEIGYPRIANGVVYLAVTGRGVVALRGSDGHQLWDFNPGFVYFNNPTLARGLVIVQSGRFLWALNSKTGHQVWTKDAGSGASGPAAGNGLIYVPSVPRRGRPTHIVALNIANGKRLWSTTLNDGETAPLVASNGELYVGMSSGEVFALNGQTGKTMWTFRTGLDIWAAPLATATAVYVGSSDFYLYALDPATGQLLWRFRDAGSVGYAPMLYRSTLVEYSDDGRIITGISLATHTRVWDHVFQPSALSSPVYANGLIYAGSSTGQLYAFSQTDGAIAWTFSAGGGTSAPIAADGNVYFGSTDGYLYALNGVTGTLKWKYDAGSPVDVTPAVANGVVYDGTVGIWYGGNLFALNAVTGAQIWNVPGDGELLSRPTVADGLMYIGDASAWNTKTGKWVWTADGTTGVGGSSSPAVGGGDAYFGDVTDGFRAVDAKTGSEVWSFPVEDGVNASPTYASGSVYVGTNGGRVDALDAATGTERWSYLTGNIVASTPLVTPSTVYVGSDDGYLYALAVKDGSLTWRFKAPSEVDTRLALAGNNLYMTSGRTLYALNATTGQRIWSASTS